MTTYTKRHDVFAGILLTVSTLLLCASPAQAGGSKSFAGNGDTSFGGPIGTATLLLTGRHH